jgi:branched-subunit amino acid aminotransferase/4-amino-4-deoxychorismate lyase
MAGSKDTSTDAGQKVSLNGRLVPVSEAMVPVFDRGFAYGDALIETMKLVDGRPVFFAEHYNRLARGMEEAGMKPQPLESELWRQCAELVEANGVAGGRLRLQVTRGAAPPAEGPEPGNGHELTLLITALESGGYPGRFYREGMACATVPANRGAWASLKTSSLMTTVLARRMATAAGADEALFTSSHGILLEGAYTNIFFLADDVCTTTPASENILPGITRDKVIGILGEIGMQVKEQATKLEDLGTGVSAVFLTGSMLGFCPVKSIDAISFDPDRQLTDRVNELLRQQELESVSRTYE